MQTVQHTKHFAHPANWAGFLLIGGNVRLSNKVALIGQALCELMKTPEKCRDALRVCLHLVSAEKINVQKDGFVKERFICRLKKACSAFTEDKRMLCTRLRKALITKRGL